MVRPRNRRGRDVGVCPPFVPIYGHGAASLIDVPVNEYRSFKSLEQSDTVLRGKLGEESFVRSLSPGMSEGYPIIVAYVEVFDRGKQHGEAHEPDAQATWS